MSDKRYPSSCSLRRVCLVWLTRAAAFRLCVYPMRSAVRSSSRCPALLPSPHDCTNAAAAARTWHTVTSGFFPPQPLSHPRAKQVRQRRQPLVPQQPLVIPPFVVVEAQLGLLVLEAALLVPARERHQQQRRDRRPGRGVADEVLHLVVVQGVTG